MNREKAKALLPVIQAYAEGAKIQLDCAGTWLDAEYQIQFDNITPDEIRIKPEATYRPFKNSEECWNEMQKHQPFGWVKDKDGEYIHIIHIIDTGVCGGEDLEGFCYSSAMNVYHFADGSAFGIKEGGEQ